MISMKERFEERKDMIMKMGEDLKVIKVRRTGET